MQYVLLIYTDEVQDSQASQQEQEAVTAAYYAFGNEFKEKIISSVGPLMPTSAATTVRVRDGKTLTTDGPFAETKEQLGGFYVVNATDLDEAIQMASRIPGGAAGSIEVRPVMVFE
ncbi:MAG TPA: YciI family protein [Ktedonobacterales bacterium]|nr:YciI family protein [Ktedonobacterales bacterium]